MKKIVSLLLAGIVLAVLLCAPVVAEDETAAPARPVGQVKLENLEALPTGYALISSGLLAPSTFSQYSYTLNSLTDEQQWELSRYLSYGLSVIGVSGLERPISGGIDGVWSTGNAGNKLQNGSKHQGAFSYLGNDKTYNHLGETDQEDSIYQILITFNFGKLAKLKSLGFVAGLNNMPQAADVYTSCDGENWTLLGYWDRTAMRMNDEDMPTVAATELGEDGTNAVYTNGKIVLFDLQDTEAQFLRICGVSNAGKGNPSDRSDYTTYSNKYSESSSWREMLVYGTLLDKENHVTAVEKPFGSGEDDPSDNPGDDKNDNNNDNRVPDIPVKPGNTPQKPEQSKEPEQSQGANDTSAVQTEKKGCRSVAGGSVILLLALGGGCVLITRKKQ